MRSTQALEAARGRADSATAAAAAAKKALDALELRIPKARLEADSQRARAADLSSRLEQLRADAKVRPWPALPARDGLHTALKLIGVSGGSGCAPARACDATLCASLPIQSFELLYFLEKHIGRMGAGYLAALKALPEVAKAQAALAPPEGGTGGCMRATMST